MEVFRLTCRTRGGALLIDPPTGASFSVGRESVESSVFRWESWRDSPDRCPAELASLGEGLGRSLLPYAVQRSLQNAVAACRRSRTTLRLCVEVHAEPNDAIARVPWEAIRLAALSPFDPVDGPLVLQADVAVLRCSGLPASPRAPAYGVRVLVVSADPASSAHPRLAWLGSEASAIEEACARSRAAAMAHRTLFDASPEELRRTILDFHPDVFHFVGHAEADASGSRLILVGDNGTEVPIPVETVGGWLASGGCRLAVLSACETDVGPHSAALALRRAGVDGVVAMQGSVRDACLPLFSRSLYGALIDGKEIDVAVAEARMSVAGPSCTEVLPTLWCESTFPIVGGRAFQPEAMAPNNLPTDRSSVTIGRDLEADALDRCLREGISIALVGEGGIGKSHLALIGARRALPSCPGGAWWIECGSMTTEEEAWWGIARHLSPDVREDPKRGVVEALRGRRALVVLDGAERLLELAGLGLVEALLRDSNVMLLVTTRKRIDRADVHTIELDPLATGPGRGTAEEMFLEVSGLRAVVGHQEARQVSEVCAALGGVPLAIGVAARRASLIGVAALRALLSKSPLRALGGASSIVGTAIERSLSLLPHEDRELLRRLCVFAGPFDWASAIDVLLFDEFDALDGLERLADSTLVRRTEVEGRQRFVILDPIRDFFRIAVPLGSSKSDGGIDRHRHALHFLKVAEEASVDSLEGRTALGALKVRVELANFRAALQYACETDDHDVVSSFAELLCRPLMEAGMSSDFSRFLEEGLRVAEHHDDPRCLSALLGLEGAFAGRTGDRARCERAWSRRAELCRDVGDLLGLVDAKLDLAYEARIAKEREKALSLVEEAEAVLVGLDRPDLQATAVAIRAIVELEAGSREHAARLADAAEIQVRLAGGTGQTIYVWSQLGHVWRRLDDMVRAEAAFAKAAQTAFEGDSLCQAALAMLGLSSVLESRQRIETALMGAVSAESILSRIGARQLSEAQKQRERIAERHRDHPAVRRLDLLAATEPLRLARDVLDRVEAARGGTISIEPTRDASSLTFARRDDDSLQPLSAL